MGGEASPRPGGLGGVLRAPRAGHSLEGTAAELGMSTAGRVSG